MSRKDTILETLKRQYELGKLEKKQIRIESSDLAEALGYDRSNVSRDLNELVREGKVKKSEGRPVYFWPSEYEAENQEKGKNEFSFILGIFKKKCTAGKSGSSLSAKGASYTACWSHWYRKNYLCGADVRVCKIHESHSSNCKICGVQLRRIRRESPASYVSDVRS